MQSSASAQQMLEAKTRTNLSKLNTLTHPHLLKIAKHIFEDSDIASRLITKLEHEDSALVTGFSELLNAAITEYEKAERLNYKREEAIQFTVFKYYLKFIVLFTRPFAKQLYENNKLALASLEQEIKNNEASYKLAKMNYVLGFPLLHQCANTYLLKAALDTQGWFLNQRKLIVYNTLNDFLAYYPQETINRIEESGLTGLQEVADENERLKKTNADLSKQVGDLKTQLEDANARVLRLERENAELRGITHQPTATATAASSTPAAATMNGANAPSAAQLSASLAPVLASSSSRVTPSKPAVSNELKLGGYVTEKQQFVLEKLLERYNALMALKKTAEDSEVKAIKELFIHLLHCAMLAHLKAHLEKDDYKEKLASAVKAQLNSFEVRNRTDAILSLKKDHYDFLPAILNTSGFDLLNDEVIASTKPIAGKNNLSHRFVSPLQFKLGYDTEVMATLPFYSLFNSWGVEATEDNNAVVQMIQSLAAVPLLQNHTISTKTM